MSNVAKAHNLETIVHRGHQKVVSSRRSRMPLYPPSTATDICLGKGLERHSRVEQSDSGVVTANGDKIFDVWMTLNGCHASVKSFVGDDRKLEALPCVPYLELQIISSGIDNIGVPIVPGNTPRFVGMGGPGIRDCELASLVRFEQRYGTV